MVLFCHLIGVQIYLYNSILCSDCEMNFAAFE